MPANPVPANPVPANPVPPNPVPADPVPPTEQPGPSTPVVEQRPGWGRGDDNHEHTGPPGQSKDKGKEKDGK